MKIAMLMSVFGEHAVGGAERSAERVARGLVAHGHQVDMVSLSAPGTARHTREFAPGIHLTSVPLFQCYDPYGLGPVKSVVPHGALAKALWHGLDVYNPVMGRRLDRVWADLQPDVVVTHTIQGFSVAAWRSVRRAGLPLVHVLHDHSLLCPGTAMTRGTEVCDVPCTRCATYGRARQQMAVLPDGVLAPSLDVLNRHLDHGWFNQVAHRRVIANSLPPDWPVVTQAVFPSPGEPLRFAFVGRLDASKGLDTLLEATRLLADLPLEVHLGGGGDVPALRAQIGAMGLQARVTVHGAVDTAVFLRGMHVLVAPSRARETFNNVALEAACTGVPAIVSDRGALPERVGHGLSGWVFPVGDARALAARMRHCIDHPQDVHDKAVRALVLRAGAGLDAEIGAWEEFLLQVPGCRGAA
jgi:glycosyltransferase involved in cell wall biosynthesis